MLLLVLLSSLLVSCSQVQNEAMKKLKLDYAINLLIPPRTACLMGRLVGEPPSLLVKCFNRWRSLADPGDRLFIVSCISCCVSRGYIFCLTIFNLLVNLIRIMRQFRFHDKKIWEGEDKALLLEGNLSAPSHSAYFFPGPGKAGRGKMRKLQLKFVIS